jgi:hypothetical protein
MLRRLPRRLDRIGGSLERGQLGLNVRLLADQSDRKYLTELLHQLVLTFLAATLGIMTVLMLGLHGGPDVTHRVTLYASSSTACSSSPECSRYACSYSCSGPTQPDRDLVATRNGQAALDRPRPWSRND